MKLKKSHLRSGFTLVETAIATAILAYVTVNFVGSFANLAYSQVRSRLMLEAADYAREGLEVTYNLNANTFNDPLFTWDTQMYALIGGTSYYPSFNPISKKVTLETGSEDISSFFQRSLTFHQVCRNPPDGELQDLPCAVIDPNVVKVISKVTIKQAETNTDIELTSYLLNPNSI